MVADPSTTRRGRTADARPRVIIFRHFALIAPPAQPPAAPRAIRVYKTSIVRRTKYRIIMQGHKTPLAIFHFAIFKLLLLLLLYNSLWSSLSPPPSLMQFYLFIIIFFIPSNLASRHPPINYCENIRFCRFRTRSDARREIRFTHSTRGVVPVITFHTSFRHNNVSSSFLQL